MMKCEIFCANQLCNPKPSKDSARDWFRALVVFSQLLVKEAFMSHTAAPIKIKTLKPVCLNTPSQRSRISVNLKSKCTNIGHANRVNKPLRTSKECPIRALFRTGRSVTRAVGPRSTLRRGRSCCGGGLSWGERPDVNQVDGTKARISIAEVMAAQWCFCWVFFCLWFVWIGITCHFNLCFVIYFWFLLPDARCYLFFFQTNDLEGSMESAQLFFEKTAWQLSNLLSGSSLLTGLAQVFDYLGLWARKGIKRTQWNLVHPTRIGLFWRVCLDKLSKNHQTQNQ